MCGTKNFASVRLYSAPQLHRTIVTIVGICAHGTPKQVETRRHNQTDPLPGFPSGRLTSSNKARWVLSSQDSSVAPQTSQDA